MTVPPGTSVAPGVTFIKTWAISNDGDVPWDRAFLVFAGGELLAQAPAIALPSVAPGEGVNVSLEVQAPKSGGRAVSQWAFMDAGGAHFGPHLIIDVDVQAAHAHDINAARDTLAALIRVGRAVGLEGLPPLKAPPLADGPSSFPYLEELWSMAKALESHLGVDVVDEEAGEVGTMMGGGGGVEEDLFEIAIRWRSGNQVFTISVSPAHRVQDVVEVVSRQTGVDSSSLSLAPAFQGNVPPDGLVLLDPSATLASIPVTPSSTLELLSTPTPSLLGP